MEREKLKELVEEFNKIEAKERRNKILLVRLFSSSGMVTATFGAFYVLFGDFSKDLVAFLFAALGMLFVGINFAGKEVEQ